MMEFVKNIDCFIETYLCFCLFTPLVVLCKYILNFLPFILCCCLLCIFLSPFFSGSCFLDCHSWYCFLLCSSGWARLNPLHAQKNHTLFLGNWAEKWMYGDYHIINRKTIFDYYPMPSPEEFFDRLRRTRIFSILDLRSRYR